MRSGNHRAAIGRAHGAQSIRVARPPRPCCSVRAAGATAPPASEAQLYSELAASMGATGPACVGSTPLGRGLVAPSDLEGGSVLVSVPLPNALVICDDPVGGISVFSDRHNEAWQAVHGALPDQLLDFVQGDARWDVRMTAWLLHLRAEGQRLWRRYLCLLPAERDMCCLLNYSDVEREALQLPELQAEALVQAEWADWLHAKHFGTQSGELAALGLSGDLQTSRWAVSMVRSRTFSDEVNGEMVTLMVPFADLANHAVEQNSTFALAADGKTFQLSCTKLLVAGQEALISYGDPKPNDELLRDYGFIIPGNPHDRVRLEAAGPGGGQGEGLPRLHESSLLEATGFTGDLDQQEGVSHPQLEGSSAADPQQRLLWQRRRAALLSLPIHPREQPGGGGGGGLFGWPPKAWTSSGRPPAAELLPGQVPAERQAVAQLRAQLAAQLAELGTSITTDEAELAEWEARCSAASSSSDAAGSAAASRQAAGGAPGAGGGRGGGAARAAAAAAAAAVHQGRNPVRIAMAVRARLEHKRLLQEGMWLLDRYAAHLDAL